MAVPYDFEREDGTWIVEYFPIGECPKEFLCADGVKARRGWRAESLPSRKWQADHEPESVKWQQDISRSKANIEAGKRGEEYWRSKMPKLKNPIPEL